MSNTTRLAGFIVIVLVALVGAYAVGMAVGPLGTALADTSHVSDH